MAESAPLVGIIMGSKSDWDAMRHADEMLTRFGVSHECRVLSALSDAGALTADARPARQGRGSSDIAGAGGASASCEVICRPHRAAGDRRSHAECGAERDRFAPIDCPDAERHTRGDRRYRGLRGRQRRVACGRDSRDVTPGTPRKTPRSCPPGKSRMQSATPPFHEVRLAQTT